MRTRGGLAEDLNRIFYARSTPTLRRAQRLFLAPGIWWRFAHVAGLIVGGSLVAASGATPWWQAGGFGLNGLDFMLGRAAFSIGFVLLVMGFARALLPPGEQGFSIAGLGALLAAAVVAIALVERGNDNPYSFESEGGVLLFSSWPPPSFDLAAGYYLALYGGIIAFVGSLAGFVQTPSTPSDRGDRTSW